MNICSIIGYHGTRQTFAKKILQTNFTIDYTKVGWLGSGVYFFENNKDLASNFAKKTHKGFITDVLECRIVISRDEIFDVTDPWSNHSLFFHKTREFFLKDLIKKNKLNIKVRNSNDLDGKIYNLIAKRKGFKLIRALTYTPPSFEQEHHIPPSRVPNGIELCLKEVAYVKDKHSIYCDKEVTS